MARRIDIFLYKGPGHGDYGTAWKLYVRAVLPSNARRMVDVLERDGEYVTTTTHGKTLGRHLYTTPGAPTIY